MVINLLLARERMSYQCSAGFTIHTSYLVQKSQYMCQYSIWFRFMMVSFFFPLLTKLFRLFLFFLHSLVYNITHEYLTIHAKTIMYKSKILQNYVSWWQETLQLKTKKKPPIQTPQKNPPNKQTKKPQVPH